MKKKKRFGVYSRKTYQVYGQEPMGNHYLNIIMFNDRKATDYVSKNAKALAKLPKNDAIKLIKSHVGSDWAKDDARKIKNINVRAKDLKSTLRHFNG